MIWKQNINLSTINEYASNSIIGELGIEFMDYGDDYLTARMPVNHKTVQPYGILHGGASVTLAETVGSMAAELVIENRDTHIPVGVEINANHLSSVSEGYVFATARPVRIGRTLQVWNIEIKNENNKMICVSRLTMAVVPRKR